MEEYTDETPVASEPMKFPWGCDFGSHGVALYDFYECQMTQNPGNDAFWRIISGETPTNYTGPSSAMLEGHGMFFFISNCNVNYCYLFFVKIQELVQFFNYYKNCSCLYYCEACQQHQTV